MTTKRAIYICFEGIEGVGKTTQCKKLYEYLIEKEYKVLLTKEPGTPHLPLTMKLREFMLDKQYDGQLTDKAREFINQAIRSIHIEKLIIPALTEYDYIIQDRGILSGLSYGETCGNDPIFLKYLDNQITAACDVKQIHNIYQLYNYVIYLHGNIEESLNKSVASKKEFESGDAMESKGLKFMYDVKGKMDTYADNFNTLNIYVTNKDIDQVFDEIKVALKIK